MFEGLGENKPHCMGTRACFGIQRGLRKLRSSVEAVFGWKSYLYIMGELPDAKNQAKKAARDQECTYKVVLRSLRRDCAETDLTSGELVRVPHAPPLVCLDLYVGDMILTNCSMQKNSQ